MKTAKRIFGRPCLYGMVAALAATVANAETPHSSILELQSGNVALMLEYESYFLSGNGTPVENYARIPLIGTPMGSETIREGSAGTGDSGETQVEGWGYADVLIHCDRYDYVLYRYSDKTVEAVYAETVAADANTC